MAQSKEKRRQYKQKVQTFLREAKARPCTDCGIPYPYYIMQFDHVRGEKNPVLRASNHRRLTGMHFLSSMPKAKEEIAKCEVVCANCHAERTHKRYLASQSPK